MTPALVLDLREVWNEPGRGLIAVPKLTSRARAVEGDGWSVRAESRRPRTTGSLSRSSITLVEVTDPAGSTILVAADNPGYETHGAVASLLGTDVAHLVTDYRDSRAPGGPGWAAVKMAHRAVAGLAGQQAALTTQPPLGATWGRQARRAAEASLQWAMRGVTPAQVRSFGLSSADPASFCDAGGLPPGVSFDSHHHKSAATLFDHGCTPAQIATWHTWPRPHSAIALCEAGWSRADAQVVVDATEEDPAHWLFCPSGAQAVLFIEAGLSTVESRVAVTDPAAYPEDALRLMAAMRKKRP